MFLRARGLLISAVVSALTFGAVAVASIPSPVQTKLNDKLANLLIRELSQRYQGAKIEIMGDIVVIRGSIPATAAGVVITGESARGEVAFLVRDSGGATVAEAAAIFAAWQPSLIAVRRVLPGDKLRADMFVSKPVNIAAGMAHEYRGVILPVESDLSRIEARQTILEGQFATTTAVRTMPDIRRGETVMIEVVSGGVVLQTQGIAEEPAYMDQSIRVMTAKTKKVLSGRLRAGGHVEVQL